MQQGIIKLIILPFGPCFFALCTKFCNIVLIHGKSVSIVSGKFSLIDKRTKSSNIKSSFIIDFKSTELISVKQEKKEQQNSLKERE